MRAALYIALLLSVAPITSAGEASRNRTAISLEWTRDCLIRRGVPPRFVRIEGTDSDGADGLRRLLFWTRTPRLPQTVLIAVAGDGFLSIQSAGIAELPADHPRFCEALTYMLDRNFALAGVRFARQASDGRIVLRTDMRATNGLSEPELMEAVENLLLIADSEAPRLRELLTIDAP